MLALSRLVMSDRKLTDTMPILLDHDDGPLLEDARTVRQNRRQPFEHMRRPSVVEAEDNHARFPATRKRRNFPEVEIESEDGPVLRDSLREDRSVRQALEALVTEMQGLVTLLTKPGADANIHTHVQKESHAPFPGWSADMDLLLGEPRGIPQGLLDVLAFEVGITC